MSESLYRRDTQPEKDRLIGMVAYPDSVTSELLAPLLGDTMLVHDVGCGPSPNMAAWLVSERANYIGSDLSMPMLHARNAASPKNVLPESIMCADAFKLPLPKEAVDITLVRFVAEHIGGEENVRFLIDEAIRTSRGIVLVMSHDWTTLDSTHDWKLIGRFHELANQFAGWYSINPTVGFHFAKLAFQIMKERDISAQSRRHHRSEGDYGKELLFMGKSMIAKVDQRLKDQNNALNWKATYQLKHFLCRMNKIMSEVESRIESENPVLFTPPDIVSLTLSLNS